MDFNVLEQSAALGPYQYCISTSIGYAYAYYQNSTFIPTQLSIDRDQPGND